MGAFLFSLQKHKTKSLTTYSHVDLTNGWEPGTLFCVYFSKTFAQDVSVLYNAFFQLHFVCYWEIYTLVGAMFIMYFISIQLGQRGNVYYSA